MYTYKDYLLKTDIITIDECEKIYNQLLSVTDTGDETEKELYNELLQSMIHYAKVRSEWFSIYSREERIEKDGSRTIKHNAVIQNCNILARYQNKLGKDASWRLELGEDDRRKRIGDFACYVTFVYSLNSR